MSGYYWWNKMSSQLNSDCTATENDGVRDDEKNRPDELPYNHHHAAAFGPIKTQDLQNND